ncbi:MAG: SDR family NAD(P)-dependent oxidoreductase, partial [Bacteroidota bacterium]
MHWKEKKVLVTGGASFIGSHLVDALVERGARIRVVDDLSSGETKNIQHHLENGKVEFWKADLREQGVADKAVEGVSIAFHLAAVHGGRGYVDVHQAACASNLMLDGLLFRSCYQAK